MPDDVRRGIYEEGGHDFSVTSLSMEHIGHTLHVPTFGNRQLKQIFQKYSIATIISGIRNYIKEKMSLPGCLACVRQSEIIPENLNWIMTA